MLWRNLKTKQMDKENLIEQYRQAYYDLECSMYELKEELGGIKDEIKNLCLKFLLDSRMGKRDKDVFKEVFKKYLP